MHSYYISNTKKLLTTLAKGYAPWWRRKACNLHITFDGEICPQVPLSLMRCVIFHESQPLEFVSLSLGLKNYLPNGKGVAIVVRFLGLQGEVNSVLWRCMFIHRGIDRNNIHYSVGLHVPRAIKSESVHSSMALIVEGPSTCMAVFVGDLVFV